MEKITTKLKIFQNQILLIMSLYFLFGSLSPLCSFAQNQEWILYNRENTVFPAIYIQDIVIDRDGNKWIAHSNGLVKFNENVWASYTRANSGLPDNYIYSLLIDNQHNLWIGSSSGLTRYDGETWKVYTQYKSFLEKHNHIEDMAVDYKGNLWIGVGQDPYGSGGGLIKFDGADWTAYDSQNSILPDYLIVTSLETDIDSTIWIGTQIGLVNYDGKTWTIYNQSNSEIPFNFIASISIDENGDKWIGFFEHGVAKFDGNNWIIYNKSNSMLPDNTVYRVDFDSHDNIWIATYNGLAKFDNENWEIYKTDNSKLPNNIVLTLISDNKDVIWIGTGGGGLGILDGENWTVLNQNTPNYLMNDRIYDIEFDSHGNVWAATREGLVKFDGKFWTAYNPENSELPSYLVYDIEIDSQNNKWIATENGLVIINNENWVIYDTSNSELPLYNAVRHLTIDLNGHLWLATHQPGYESNLLEGSGLTMFDGENWMVYNTENSGLPSNYVSCLNVDNEGNIWIGTGIYGYYCKGLVQFDGDKWTIFNMENSDIHSNNVSSIAVDADNNKWIGAVSYKESYYAPKISGGLTKFNGTSWIVFNKENSPLPSNELSELLVDVNNNIWIGTTPYYIEPNEPYIGGGLVCFDGYSWQIFNTDNSLLPSNTITSLSTDDNKNIWIGSTLGIAVYNPGGVVLDIDSREQPAKKIYSIPSNYPNPFNSSTIIQYHLPKSTFVKLTIYNLIGQEIEIVINGYQRSGIHQISWAAEDLPSGIYFYRLQMDDFSETKKLVLQK